MMRSILVVLAALSASVVASAAPPLEAYGRLPTIEAAALSPDGGKIALIQAMKDGRVLTVVSIADQKLLAAARIGQPKLRDLRWADDRFVLITTASTEMPMDMIGEKVEWNLLTAFDIEKRKTTVLLEHVSDGVRTMNVVYGSPVVQRTPDGTVLYVHGYYVVDRTTPALFKINLTRGLERLVKEGGDATRGWTVDDNGEVIAEEDYVNSSRRWEIRVLRKGRTVQKVTGTEAIDAPDILGLTAAGDALVVAVREQDQVRWRTLSLADGTFGADIAPDEALTNLLLAPGSQRMIGTAFVGDEPRYHFLDPDLQAGWDWVVRACHGDRVEFVATNADRSKILYQVLGPATGYAYGIADLSEHLLTPVGRIYADVDQIAEVRKIHYKAADGFDVPAYLTLPSGRQPKKLPVIVFPHGGPEARDRIQFDWWAQALAAQGYAVLQPNFRGSSLGMAFAEAGFGEWGRKMQSDVSDGLRHLANEGIVDAARACVVGASYGGYVALAGATLEPGTYRCAASFAGISDLAAMLRQELRAAGGHSSIGTRYWMRFMGASGADDPKLNEISPIKHIDRISVPVLLIHGREDPIVPYDQSSDMAKAMKRAGKPVEFVSLDQEDHYLSRGETRLQMLRTLVEFLRRANPPD
ncbi:MAG: S9 family peptidase [Proteobacteria bacterium]|nr:S9 family peptidase [Pseudomonadota bacterium]